jgi:hypothetical protein
MPRYVFHPSPKGTHTDGQGNTGFLVTVADGAVVRSPHPVLNTDAGYTLIQEQEPEPAFSAAERIRKQLLAFKGILSDEQRARLWWPHFDAFKRAIDDRDVSAVAYMVEALPWAQNENALKAQVLALLA